MWCARSRRWTRRLATRSMAGRGPFGRHDGLSLRGRTGGERREPGGGRRRAWLRLWRGGRIGTRLFARPSGLAMVAAAFRLYPYGGPSPHGSSAQDHAVRRPRALPPDRAGTSRLGRLDSLGDPSRPLDAMLRGAGGGRRRPLATGCPSLPGVPGQGRAGVRPDGSGPRSAGTPRWPASDGIWAWPSGIRSGSGIAGLALQSGDLFPVKARRRAEMGRTVSATRPLRCVLGSGRNRTGLGSLAGSA